MSKRHEILLAKSIERELQVEEDLAQAMQRNSKLEAALTMICKAEADKLDWVTVVNLIDQYALIARKALEKSV